MPSFPSNVPLPEFPPPSLSVNDLIQCAHRAMSEQIEEVNQLLETSFQQITQEFMSIGQALRHQPLDATALERQVAQVIVSLQFQDRVSQNLVIAKQLFDATQKHLNDEAGGDFSTPIHAQNIMDMLRLGEIRQKFIQQVELQGGTSERQRLELPDHVALTAPQAATSDDDIDLF